MSDSGAPFLTVPESSMVGVPLHPGDAFQTLVAFYRYQEGAGWTFDSFDYPQIGALPSGYEYLQVGSVPSSYIVVLARSDPQMGFCPVPMPNQVPQFWQVDMPTTPGSAPAAANSTLVATFKQSIDSTTGWAFDRWASQSWDYAPDGHQLNADANGQQTLDLVFARTDPVGTIVGIPYNHQQGGLPMPQPQPQPMTGGKGSLAGGEQDEVGACCTNIVAALQALTTSVQAIATLIGTHGATVSQQQPDTCCENVVKAISQVSDGIASVVKELPNLAGREIDLAGVVEALNAMSAAVTDAIDNQPARFEGQTSQIVEAIKGSQADASAQLKRIADAMPTAPAAPAEPDPWIRQLINRWVSDGALDPAVAQLLTE